MGCDPPVHFFAAWRSTHHTRKRASEATGCLQRGGDGLGSLNRSRRSEDHHAVGVGFGPFRRQRGVAQGTLAVQKMEKLHGSVAECTAPVVQDQRWRYGNLIHRVRPRGLVST